MRPRRYAARSESDRMPFEGQSLCPPLLTPAVDPQLSAHRNSSPCMQAFRVALALNPADTTALIGLEELEGLAATAAARQTLEAKARAASWRRVAAKAREGHQGSAAQERAMLLDAVEVVAAGTRFGRAQEADWESAVGGTPELRARLRRFLNRQRRVASWLANEAANEEPYSSAAATAKRAADRVMAAPNVSMEAALVEEALSWASGRALAPASWPLAPMTIAHDGATRGTADAPARPKAAARATAAVVASADFSAEALAMVTSQVAASAALLSRADATPATAPNPQTIAVAAAAMAADSKSDPMAVYRAAKEASLPLLILPCSLPPHHLWSIPLPILPWSLASSSSVDPSTLSTPVTGGGRHGRRGR